jgi:multidrug resistance protein, MATE family
VFFPLILNLLLTGQQLMKGVGVGCRWQAMVAYINVGCYYFIGITLGVLLRFRFSFGIKVFSVLRNMPSHIKPA